MEIKKQLCLVYLISSQNISFILIFFCIHNNRETNKDRRNNFLILQMIKVQFMMLIKVYFNYYLISRETALHVNENTNFANSFQWKHLYGFSDRKARKLGDFSRCEGSRVKQPHKS